MDICELILFGFLCDVNWIVEFVVVGIDVNGLLSDCTRKLNVDELVACVLVVVNVLDSTGLLDGTDVDSCLALLICVMRMFAVTCRVIIKQMV